MADPVWKTLGFDSEEDYNTWVTRQDHLDDRRAEKAKKAAEEEAKKKKKRLFD